MKKLILLLLMICSVSVFGQSRKVEEFRQNYRADNTLVFYKSTLRMFARLSVQFADQAEQKDLPDLGKLIEGIEKIKFFTYEYSSDQNSLFAGLKDDVAEEGYETVMSGKFGANNMELFMKEKRGKPSAFVVLVVGEQGAQLMDIEGVPDLNNLVEFSRYISAEGNDFSWLKAFR
jgi:hypothetical protein